MAQAKHFGRRIRALRVERHLTQAALAERLHISASYLNLLENGRRPLTPDLLIRLAQALDLDLKSFAADADERLLSDLAEVFGNPLFEEQPVEDRELGAFAADYPEVARAVVRLHHAYSGARGSLDTLASQVLDGQDVSGIDRVRLSSEQVSDFIQRQANHFPELEEAAERLWSDAALERDELFAGLARYLERRHGIAVQIRKVGEMHGAVRRFDPDRRELVLSEVLRRGSRNFQLASQIGLLECAPILDRLIQDPQLTSDESRSLGRVALASYFAGAILMPYAEFLKATEEVRYDIELLGHRFRAGFEQVCHRLTTLRRPGAEGVPFHMVRVDIAGNISKKFSASAVQFPRFSGLCPLWNVHAAFLQPGIIRVQLSRLPEGELLFSVARTVRRHSGDYRTPTVLYSVGVGCDIASARKLVYADGIDLANLAAAVPIGITCRLCERMNCEARAFPSLRVPLTINENVRGVSFFAPVPPA